MHYAPPRLPNDISPLPNDPALFIQAAREERCLSNILVENADLSGCDLSSLSVKQAKFIRCRFAGCDLTNLDGRDVVFSACDFSNARADRAYFPAVCLKTAKPWAFTRSRRFGGKRLFCMACFPMAISSMPSGTASAS